MSKRTRTKACELAAQVLASRPELDLIPNAWALAVMFESYIEHGAAWCRKPFGPRKPVKLKIVNGGRE